MMKKTDHKAAPAARWTGWLARFRLGGWLQCLALVLAGTSAGTAWGSPAVAFFYGDRPPWNELQAFDLVVVDPGHVPDPAAPKLAHTRLAAYVSVGEVQPSRPYFGAIPKEWLRGDNRDFGSRLIDQSAPDWPRFFSESVIEPLWQAGYRAFFFDTLDSYQLFAKTPEARAAQEAGMVRLVMELKRRHPQAQLIFNRGFEILDRVHEQVTAVAAESLFQGYDNSNSSYRVVPQADRDWLLGQLKKARDEYKLEVISIDYVAPDQKPLARQTAEKIRQLGFTPWVTTPDLTGLGIGAVEVMPRRVLMVHSVMPNEFGLRDTAAVRFATMPLNYLGYVPEYADVQHLPRLPNGLYAGVVVWLSTRTPAADLNKLAAWLLQAKSQGVPVVLMDDLGVALDTALGRNLGFAAGAKPRALGGIQVEQQAQMIGFERAPHPVPDDFFPLSITGGDPLLTLARGKDRQVAAAITPWGGYVMAPYSVVTLPSGKENRWVIDPFAFFRAALHLPEMPVPDVSTTSGRRTLLIHMDGDGFVSRSELPGHDYAGAVVLNRVVRKYDLPMTMSVIQAEVGPDGLYPKDSPALEAIARQIFAAPNVEIASHSYSHPFNWRRAEDQNSDSDGEGFSLNIPGYKFDLRKEVEGSINYINTRLAPPGKKTKMFLWTGDCEPGRDALEWTERLQVQNMNGGDTIATRSSPTMTQVEGLGLDKNGLFQVFAPNENENVYTNLWLGPFYGFERVIETYEITDKPRRLKAINLYFHTYITTKLAGMQSLDKVFAWIMKQEITPVHATDYTRQVMEFRGMVVARTPTGWRVRGGNLARTLRAPASLGTPDLDASRAVAGFSRNGDDHYIHLAADDTDLVFAAAATAQPRLVSANARITAASRANGAYSWALEGYVPLQVTLANVDGCRVRAGGRELKPVRRDGAMASYQMTERNARPLEVLCGR